MVGVELEEVFEVFDDDDEEVVDFDAEVAKVVDVDDDEEVDDSDELLLTRHTSPSRSR